MKKFLLITLLFCLTLKAHAIEFHPTLIMDFEFGGDMLATTNLGDVKAGNGIHLGIGGYITGYTNNMETLISLGYKIDSVNADNGDISFTRNPIELVQFFKFGNNRALRIGAGVTLHRNVTYECSVFALCNDYIEFDDATGFVLRTDMNIPFPNANTIGGLVVGLRMTSITYSSPVTADFSGNGVGFTVGLYF